MINTYTNKWIDLSSTQLINQSTNWICQVINYCLCFHLSDTHIILCWLACESMLHAMCIGTGACTAALGAYTVVLQQGAALFMSCTVHALQELCQFFDRWRRDGLHLWACHVCILSISARHGRISACHVCMLSAFGGLYFSSSRHSPTVEILCHRN